MIYPNPSLIRAKVDNVHTHYLQKGKAPSSCKSADGLSRAPAESHVDALLGRFADGAGAHGGLKSYCLWTDGRPRALLLTLGAFTPLEAGHLPEDMAFSKMLLYNIDAPLHLAIQLAQSQRACRSMESLPFFDQLINSGPVVKGVLFLLAAASVASWAIAFEKLFRFLAFARRLRELTAKAHAVQAQNWLAQRFQTVADAEPGPCGETRPEFNARLERSLQTEASAQI